MGEGLDNFSEAILHISCWSVQSLATSASLNETDSQQRIDSQQHHDEASGRGDPPKWCALSRAVFLPCGYSKVVAAMASRQPQRSFFDPEMLAILGEAVAAWPVPEVPAQPSRKSQRHQNLTPRERMILAEIVRGHSSKEVARAFGISPRTVEFHRANLLKKFGAKNTAELVRKVLS